MNYPLSLLVGYAIVAIVLGGLLLLAVLSSIIIYYLHKRNLNSYRQLQTDEDNEEDNQVVKPKTEIDKPKDIFIENLMVKQHHLARKRTLNTPNLMLTAMQTINLCHCTAIKVGDSQPSPQI